MKCEKCGANLAIDNAFCPYCGAENKIAKKHREDMSAYKKDYQDTKTEVVGNAKRFNKKTLRITAVAVTIAAIALIAFYISCYDDICYRYEYEKSMASDKKIERKLLEYMDDRDYFGFYEYADAVNASFRYGTVLYQYSYAQNMTYYFISTYNNIMKVTTSYDCLDDSSYCITEINRNYSSMIDGTGIRYLDETDSEILEYTNALLEDADNFMKVYLGLTDEDLKTYKTASEARRLTIIEEACNNVCE